MTERNTAAIFFGAAALVFWLGFSIVIGGPAWWLIVPGTLAASCVAWLVGPAMARDALRAPDEWRGIMPGLGIAPLSYGIGAVLLTMGMSAIQATEQIRGGEAFDLYGSLDLLVLALMFSFYFSPALLFGAGAGWLFYRTVRRGET
ncbi:MAG: hypothetical protein AAF624_10690 [Bacteroidota bacterium]